MIVEAGHDGILFAGGHTPVEDADSQVWEDVTAEALVFLGGSLGFGDFGLLD